MQGPTPQHRDLPYQALSSSPLGKYPKFVEDGVPGAHLGPATF